MAHIRQEMKKESYNCLENRFAYHDDIVVQVELGVELHHEGAA